MCNECKYDESVYEELFYDRLAQLRSAKKVSARDMGLSIGQNPGYINGLENRKVIPSMAVFFYIFEYLNVTLKEFFDGAMHSPDILKEIYQDMQSLDRESLKLLHSLS